MISNNHNSKHQSNGRQTNTYKRDGHDDMPTDPRHDGKAVNDHDQAIQLAFSMNDHELTDMFDKSDIHQRNADSKHDNDTNSYQNMNQRYEGTNTPETKFKHVSQAKSVYQVKPHSNHTQDGHSIITHDCHQHGTASEDLADSIARDDRQLDDDLRRYNVAQANRDHISEMWQTNDVACHRASDTRGDDTTGYHAAKIDKRDACDKQQMPDTDKIRQMRDQINDGRY